MPRKNPYREWSDEEKDKHSSYQYKLDNDGQPRWRKAHFKFKYNLTLEEYQLMAEAQEFKCAICFGPPETMLYVDHNHVTNRVRGLLCRECNAGLGFFKDNVENLRRAARYIESEPNEND